MQALNIEPSNSTVASANLRNTLMTHLAPGRRILDLGSMSINTSQVFLDAKCYCHFEDLPEFIDQINREALDQQSTCDALMDFLMPVTQGKSFDVVLTWDIFNYLDLSAIETLMLHYAPVLSTGAVLHTLRYSGSEQPKNPLSFSLTGSFDWQHAQFKNSSSGKPAVTKARGYSTMSLLKPLQGFSMASTCITQLQPSLDVTEHILEFGLSIAQQQQRRKQYPKAVSNQNQQNSQRLPLPCLTEHLRPKAEGPRLRLLECGHDKSKHSDRLRQQTQCYFLEDIYSSLNWQQRTAPDAAIEWSNLLTFPSQQAFDRVLLWDLLNYCHPQHIKALGERLWECLAPNGRVHLLWFNQLSLNEFPSIFSVGELSDVSIASSPLGQSKRLIATTTELLSLLPSFRLENYSPVPDSACRAQHELILERRS